LDSSIHSFGPKPLLSFLVLTFSTTKDNNDLVFQNVKEDILSRFLMESKKGQTTITDKYLRDIILNFMIAGKDTTANTLSWFFYMLCKNPLVEDKIVQEIRDVTCSHESELSNIDEFAANLTDSILDKMHYLHAALTETLRLYPVVPVVCTFYKYS